MFLGSGFLPQTQDAEVERRGNVQLTLSFSFSIPLFFLLFILLLPHPSFSPFPSCIFPFLSLRQARLVQFSSSSLASLSVHFTFSPLSLSFPIYHLFSPVASLCSFTTFSLFQHSRFPASLMLFLSPSPLSTILTLFLSFTQHTSEAPQLCVRDWLPQVWTSRGDIPAEDDGDSLLQRRASGKVQTYHPPRLFSSTRHESLQC